MLSVCEWKMRNYLKMLTKEELGGGEGKVWKKWIIVEQTCWGILQEMTYEWSHWRYKLRCTSTFCKKTMDWHVNVNNVFDMTGKNILASCTGIVVKCPWHFRCYRYLSVLCNVRPTSAYESSYGINRLCTFILLKLLHRRSALISNADLKLHDSPPHKRRVKFMKRSNLGRSFFRWG